MYNICILLENIYLFCTNLENSGEQFLGELFFFANLTASADTFLFYRQCTYIVLILQCQQVYNNWQDVLKGAETIVVLIVFKGVFYHSLLLKLLPLLSVHSTSIGYKKGFIRSMTK